MDEPSSFVITSQMKHDLLYHGKEEPVKQNIFTIGGG